MDMLTKMLLLVFSLYLFWVWGTTPVKQKKESKVDSLEKEITLLSKQIEELREHNKYR